MLARVRCYLTIAAALALPIVAGLAPKADAAEQNGRLPRSALAEIQIPGSNIAFLHGSIAASWNTMNLCATRDGAPLYPTSSSYTPAATAYRDYATQVILRRQLGHNAAIPGYSNHGWGRAVDLGDGGTGAMRRWTDVHGGAFGWTKATSDAAWENWHLAAARLALTWSAPDPGTSYQYPVLRTGSRGLCLGGRVREAQRLLGIPETSHFGRHMAAALKSFKQAHSLKADTTLGERTWQALRHPTPVASEKTTDIVHPLPRPLAEHMAADATCPRLPIEGAHPGVCAPQSPVAALSSPQTGQSVLKGERGFDTSNNDPASLADLQAMRRAGLTFGWVKVIEGVGFVDRFAASQARDARAAGIEVGGYDFAHVCLVSARAEADRMVDQLRGVTATLKPILDAEYGGSGCSTRQWVSDWIDQMHQRGHAAVGIYTGNWWWAPHAGCWWPAGVVSWISGYPNAQAPCGSGGITVHQDSDHYRVPGVGFSFDGNVLLGTPDQILATPPVPAQIAYDCQIVARYRSRPGAFGHWRTALHRRNARGQGFGCIPKPHAIRAQHLPQVAPKWVYIRCFNLQLDLRGRKHPSGEVHRLRAYIAAQGYVCHAGVASR